MGPYRNITIKRAVFIPKVGFTMGALKERTFIMVKPDGVQRGFLGEIIKRFEKKGFKLVALKFLRPPEDLIREHYRGLASRSFFPDLVKYISTGPVVPMVWEAPNAVSLGRQIVGAKNFADSQLGNIRGDFCVSPRHDSCNIIHGSDSVNAAEKEIGLWFTEKEIVDWRPAAENYVLPII